VIVLILVAILWIAVLVPSVISRMRERRSAGSIGRFHQRLDLLERTGPKLVQPAYRLTGTDGVASPNNRIVVATPPPVRPYLTLVSPTGDEVPSSGALRDEQAQPHVLEEVVMDVQEAAEDFEDFEDPEYDEPLAEELPEADRRVLMALKRRQAARRRRRDVFATLCALTAVTGLLGLARPMRVAWVLSGVFLVLLVAFVALAMYGQRIEAERRHLANLHIVEQARVDEDDVDSPTVKYLSEDELAQYHEALANHYEEEHLRLAAQA
jgi:hypothetical protein